MNLRSFDLNLLVVFDALVEEGSVRRAAERIGLSQSATSHALDRLRKLVGDDILVRTPTGMEPTPRSAALAGPIRSALQQIGMALVPPHFVPGESQGSFTVAVETYETIEVLPQLVDEFQREAPGMTLNVRSGPVAEILSGVDQGRTDLAIGLFGDLPDRFMTTRLLADSYVCSMRADHPLAGTKLTMPGYLGASHLLVSMSGNPSDAIDDALAALGLHRRIALRLPHGLAAVVALARTDLLATVTRGAARLFAEAARLSVVDLPIQVMSPEFRLVWNRRLHDDPAHIWLRRKLVSIATAARRA